jgi:hypothetical protein
VCLCEAKSGAGMRVAVKAQTRWAMAHAGADIRIPNEESQGGLSRPWASLTSELPSASLCHLVPARIWIYDILPRPSCESPHISRASLHAIIFFIAIGVPSASHRLCHVGWPRSASGASRQRHATFVLRPPMKQERMHSPGTESIVQLLSLKRRQCW